MDAAAGPPIPRANRGLGADIVASGGLVVSQFFPPPRWPGEPFGKRNELTSGISQGTAVIEALEVETIVRGPRWFPSRRPEMQREDRPEGGSSRSRR